MREERAGPRRPRRHLEARREVVAVAAGKTHRDRFHLSSRSMKLTFPPARLCPALLPLGAPSHAADPGAAIVGATVVHPEREGAAATTADTTVIIEGQRIRAVGPAKDTPVPAGASVIDAKGKWVIPGLVDAHVHFFQSGNLYTRPDAADLNKWMPYAKEVARNQARLPATFKVWIASGDYLVHSVEDQLVDDEFLALAKRNHAIYCPTLFVVMGYRYALSNTWRPTEAEKRLADPQILAAMSDLERIPKDLLPERVTKAMVEPPMPRPSPIALQNLRKVWEAGIPVAMGTDAGNVGTLHGPSVFREMDLMTYAGLTPLQVLRTATVNGARAMRLEGKIGTIERGKLADLVILDADPLLDVANLSRIHRVIKDGRVYDSKELMRSLAP